MESAPEFLIKMESAQEFFIKWKAPRENEGTERDIEGVGWDISIPLKLFLVLDGNGSLFPQTSA